MPKFRLRIIEDPFDIYDFYLGIPIIEYMPFDMH